MLTKIRVEKFATVVLAIAYTFWASLFIYESSYVAVDGQRYFGLFDDAMISMRYAWNFAHGLGLVWNAGQRIEGYSNLLMTLIMSLAALVLNKKLAVLAVQIFGVVIVLMIAEVARRISNEIHEGRPHRESIGLLVAAGVLLYYPLSYWTLMGMETGLLTLLILTAAWFALKWLRTLRSSRLLGLSLMAGLAFLTRNDSFVLSAVVFAYIAVEVFVRKLDRRFLVQILYAVVLFAVFPIGQTLFRYVYYGALLPNTYVLKLTGIPLGIRLIGGTRFVLEFLQQSAPVLALAVLDLFLEFRLVRAFLFSLMMAAIAYQVYAGGDPWESWRLLAPAMPALLILAVGAAVTLGSRWRPLASRKYALALTGGLLSLGALMVTDLPFLSDMAVSGPTSAAIANRVNTSAAVAIEALTQPNASIGVIWAGTLPYYADRVGVDFLGKSDAHIAQLKADVSGAVSWGGMISVPGHNKYDLEYSIVQLQPTYIQAFSWGAQTVKPWVTQHYVRVEYHGAIGTKTIFLWKDSPLVCWEACKEQYKIIPWPGQK